MRLIFTLQKVLDHWTDSLIGHKQISKRWISEFYGEIETSFAQNLWSSIPKDSVVAYVDPFENLKSHGLNRHPGLDPGSRDVAPVLDSRFRGNDRNLLWLKPKDLSEALGMIQTLMQTPAVDWVIIDSLFWFSVTQFSAFHQAMKRLVEMSQKYEKPLILINPVNGVREKLSGYLEQICSQQFRPHCEQ